MAPDPPPSPRVTPAAGQHEVEHPVRCTNCGAGLSGDYCSACGQAVKYHVHSFLELLSEFTEVLTHADSRLWRTLRALLFKPGFLTRQFLAGRRASYLSPYRLYFAMSVLFFLVISFVQTDTTTHPKAPAASRASPSAVAGDAQASQELCEHAIGHSLIPAVNKYRQLFVAACIRSQADHGRELRESFIQNLGRAMFVLLPLMAAFMKLLYWRPTYSYVTHFLLLLHYQALVFLLMAIALMAQRWLPLDTAGPLVPLLIIGYVIYYLFRSMRLVYADTRPRTLVKCSTLLVVYLACAVCAIVLTGLYSAERLLGS